MSKPVVAETMPKVMELEEGTYKWCSCGRSANQPFCDGSHKGTDFEPMEFAVEKKRNYALCQCKHTQKPPFCDGSHSKLD